MTLSMINSLRSYSIQGVKSKSTIKAFLQYYCLYFSGVLVVLLDRYALPSKYFVDNKTIQMVISLLNNGIHFGITNGFANTARIYLFTGLGNLSSVQSGLITYSVWFLLLYFSVRSLQISKFAYIMVLAWNLISAVYIGQYTKEFLASLVVFLFFKLIKQHSNVSVFISFVILSSYAFFDRTYWFIIVSLSLLLYSTRNFSLFKKYIFRIIGTFIPFVLYDHSGHYITSVRTRINYSIASTTGSNTMIHNFMHNTSFFTDYLNWVVTLFKFFIPYTLIYPFNPEHLLFAVLNVSSLVLIIFKYTQIRNCCTRVDKYLFYWIISFVLVQGMFEPDFGSYVKHQVVFIPLFFYLLLRFSNRLLEDVYEN